MPLDIDIGDGADALTINQLSDALTGTYWTSGWTPSLGTGDLEVDIASGSGSATGSSVLTQSTQTVDFTGDPDSSDPRKAVIFVNDTGTVQKTLGPPAPPAPSDEVRFRTWDPAPPADPPGVVVAEVWLPAGASTLSNSDLRDRRLSNDAATEVNSRAFTDRNSVNSFTESAVEITHTDTQVLSGTLRLQREFGSTASRPGDTNSNTPSSKRGIGINPNTDLKGIEATVSANTSGLNTVQLLDGSDNVLVEDTSVSGDGDVARLEHDLTAGTTYYVVGYDSSGYTSGANYSASHPYTSSDIDITSGYLSSSTKDDQDSAHVIVDVTAITTLTGLPTSGSAIVELPMSQDLHQWDAATFKQVLDNGSVDIYIEEDQSGGWTEIAGPISRGASIPADAGNNVRFRVEFTRPTSDDEPRLTSLYRRWEL